MFGRTEATDGSWRKVEIRLVGPGAKEFRVRSRKGYYALYKK